MKREATATERPNPSCRVPGTPREHVFKGDYSFNTGTVRVLTVGDYFFFVATLFISAAIGIYVTWINRKRHSINEYVLAGRSMGLLPVTFSLFASFVSAVSLLGIPAEVYQFSTMYLWTAPCYIIVSALTAELYMPVFFQLQLSSVFQYLEMRFSRKVRIFAALLFITEMIVYMSIVLTIPSIAINKVTGINVWLAAFSVGFISIFYTTAGGVRAVIWTDFFQIGVFLTGLLLMILWSHATVISTRDVFASTYRTSRLKLVDFRPDISLRHNVWSTLVGGIGLWSGFYACGQSFIHRCLTCKTLDTAKKAVWYTGFMMSFNTCLLILLGLFMAALYENCDPLTANIINKSNEIFPLYVMDTMSYGMPGVFLATVLSATLSSVSSAMSSLSTVVLEDLIRPFSNVHIYDDRARWMTQAACLIAGFLSLDLIVLMLKIKDVVQVTTYVNIGFSSPVLGVFSLGLFFPWVNATGGIYGAVTSFAFNLFVIILHLTHQRPLPEKALTCLSNCNPSIFSNETLFMLKEEPTTRPPIDTSDMSFLVRMSFQWICVLSSILCILVGLFVSWLTGDQNTTEFDPRLIVPVADIVYPLNRLPEKTRKRLRFGVSHTDKWMPSCARKDTRASEKNPSIINDEDFENAPLQINGGLGPKASNMSSDSCL